MAIKGRMPIKDLIRKVKKTVPNDWLDWLAALNNRMDEIDGFDNLKDFLTTHPLHGGLGISRYDIEFCLFHGDKVSNVDLQNRLFESMGYKERMFPRNKEIVKMCKGGKTQQEVAKLFGISQQTVSKIIDNYENVTTLSVNHKKSGNVFVTKKYIRYTINLEWPPEKMAKKLSEKTGFNFTVS